MDRELAKVVVDGKAVNQLEMWILISLGYGGNVLISQPRPFSAASIARELGVSRERGSMPFGKLKRLGLIRGSGRIVGSEREPKGYELTRAGRNLRESLLTMLDRIQWQMLSAVGSELDDREIDPQVLVLALACDIGQNRVGSTLPRAHSAIARIKAPGRPLSKK